MNAILLLGGPTRTIQVDGVRYNFEMHPRLGPCLLGKDGEPVSVRHPKQKRFLYAASLWAVQGQRIEDGLCRWDHKQEDILRHIGGRNYVVVGQKPVRCGE